MKTARKSLKFTGEVNKGPTKFKVNSNTIVDSKDEIFEKSLFNKINHINYHRDSAMRNLSFNVMAGEYSGKNQLRSRFFSD